jgi:hypothetical protein
MMTTNPEALEAVEVTQEDREAGAALITRLHGSADYVQEQGFRSGESDDHPTIQAFARHRIAARSAHMDEAAGLQPSTAENPNESAYQRGRFDGIMEFATAIRAAVTP